MCGEKPNRLTWEHWQQGSPPHVRGKVSPKRQSINGQGITPACAGKSASVDIHVILDRDHPRMCGEKPADGFHVHYWKGSPPHVRGKAD